MKCLDVEDYEENAILLLKQLLPRVKVEKEHLSLDAERITPELAILFRMHCDTLKQDKVRFIEGGTARGLLTLITLERRFARRYRARVDAVLRTGRRPP